MKKTVCISSQSSVTVSVWTSPGGSKTYEPVSATHECSR